jgi:hypothetical protein
MSSSGIQKSSSYFTGDTSLLQRSTGYCYVRFEVFTAVTMKNDVFWDLRRVALIRTEVSKELSASIIWVTRISCSSSPILVTLMMEALSS